MNQTTIYDRSTRRTFLKQAAAASATFAAPALIYGSPNEKVNIAGVGVQGKGRSDLSGTAPNNNVVALCDVDAGHLEKAAKTYTGAKKYNDWRKMLEQSDIDAITVSTPDHMHAPIAMTAMRMGKHVYVQKPLAHTVYEARQMRLAAQKHGVISQMGNQGHSGSGYKTLVNWIQAGVIGKVKEAHAWSNRPIWPQGIDRPKTSSEPPENLDWDLWLGVAKYRPFVGPQADSKRGRGLYHPFNWRGWLDFGVGALGDMGCHIIDPVVWSLGLSAPKKVKSVGPKPNTETFPNWGIIHYDFAATKYTVDGDVRMTWYDGGKKPSTSLVPDGVKIPDNGCLLIGTEGTVLCQHGKNPVVLPGSKAASAELPVLEDADHYQQWANAIKNTDTATSSFDYAGPLTETVLLGTIAIRFSDETLKWDSENLKFPNKSAADEFVHHAYRKGWEVKGLS